MTANRFLLLFCAITTASLALPGCSIQRLAMKTTADMLAPSPHARPRTGSDPMIALTGENDPELVADFFPTALKLYEIMMLQTPRHEGLALFTGQLYIMYANAFIQTPAEQLPSESFSDQNTAFFRAKNLYLRGAGFVLNGIDIRYPGFKTAIQSGNEQQIQLALKKLKKPDVSSLYWAGAGILGAFALDPMDSTVIPRVYSAALMLEHGTVLDPAYSNGALWEVLMAFYAAAPESMGGGKEKSRMAYEQALHWSKGQNPSTWIGYARTFAIPAQDSAGFDEAISRALAIDPDSRPQERLILTIARRQALWLKNNKPDFILE